MQESVTALQFDAEQQIEKAGEGGRLAGLVRPVDDVQVGLAVHPFPEIDRLVGEPAVACKVQASQPHQPVSASAAGPEPRQHVVDAIPRGLGEVGGERVRVRAEQRPALRRKLGPQLFGDRRDFGAIRVVLRHLAHQTAQLLERIGLGRHGRRRHGSRRPAIDLDLVYPALAERGGLVLRLGSQQVEVPAQAPGQRASSRSDAAVRRDAPKPRRRGPAPRVRPSVRTMSFHSSIPPSSTVTRSNWATLVSRSSSRMAPSSATVASVTDLAPASLMSRPCGMPGITTVAGALRGGALVDVAERPIAEPGRLQLRQPAGRVGIVSRRPVKAGVQQSDVYRALDRRLEAVEQAVGRMRLGEADPVDGHGNCAALPLHGDGGGAATEDGDRVRGR